MAARMKLVNRTAVVAGAAAGIGRAISLSLARRGCHLALADVNEAGLADTAQMAAATKVMSGSVVQEGRLAVYAEHVGNETITARIAAYVERSLAVKGQTQMESARLADRLPRSRSRSRRSSPPRRWRLSSVGGSPLNDLGGRDPAPAGCVYARHTVQRRRWRHGSDWPLGIRQGHPCQGHQRPNPAGSRAHCRQRRRLRR